MRTNRSEHVANVTLAQAARAASRPYIATVPHHPVRARIIDACAPGSSIGATLRLVGFVVVVALAATYGSMHV